MAADPRPLVSIVIPAFNADRFVGRAITSALSQTYTDLEILVVDDGSSDGTARVIQSFRDGRIRYLFQPNQGQGAARNRAIRMSTGKYVTFLDADDCYLPRKVERQVVFLERHPDHQVAFCAVVHFYSRHPGRLYGRPYASANHDILRDLLQTSLINPNALMIRGDVVRGGFFFREERYYPEEWDLCLRLARAGYRFGYLDEALAVVEIREGSNTAMAIQGTLKRHALEMFQRLFSEMSEQERQALGADAVLRVCKARLAAACLVGERPADSASVLTEIASPGIATLARTVLCAIPPGAVRTVARGAWRLRQRLSLTRWRDPHVEREWRHVWQHRR